MFALQLVSIASCLASDLNSGMLLSWWLQVDRADLVYGIAIMDKRISVGAISRASCKAWAEQAYCGLYMLWSSIIWLLCPQRSSSPAYGMSTWIESVKRTCFTPCYCQAYVPHCKRQWLTTLCKIAEYQKTLTADDISCTNFTKPMSAILRLSSQQLMTVQTDTLHQLASWK